MYLEQSFVNLVKTKTVSGLLFLAAAVFVATPANASLIMEFKFNGNLNNTGSAGGVGSFVTNIVTPTIGEGLGGPGTGMDNTSAFGWYDLGGYMNVPVNSDYDNLTSYTVSAFYRIPENDASGGGLTGGLGGYIVRENDTNSAEGDASEKPGFTFIHERGRNYLGGNGAQAYQLPPYDTRYYMGPTTETDGSGDLVTDVWVFTAMTYDGATGISNLYAARSDDPTLQLMVTKNLTNGPPAVGTLNFLLIGNTATGTRAFKGLLDNVRLHGSKVDSTGALSVSALQSLANDGFAEIVPEPATLSLLAVSLGVLVSRRSRLGRV